MRNRGLIFLLFGMVLLFGYGTGQPAEFPAKPIVLVVPVGAGGSHDLTARAVASVANDYLGQPIIVQVKPGGGGAIGSDFVSKAAPDGYTLLFGGPGWSITLPAMEGRSKGPDDLDAVCRINYSATTIICKPDLPYKTFKEMIEWAKANPGKLVFGNTGPWGQADLSWKRIMKETGISTKTVPYDGGGPALLALLGGHVDVTAMPAAPIFPHLNAGKLRAIAVLDEKRDDSLPGVPTAREAGVDVIYLMWRGVLAPKGTPRAVIDKLAAAFKKMTEDKTVINLIKQFGDEIQYLGPNEFTKIWKAEYESHRDLYKSLKK